MPDKYDMELDARPTQQELCPHENMEYQEYEADTKANNKISVNNLKSAVNLEAKKMQLNTESAKKELQGGKK